MSVDASTEDRFLALTVRSLRRTSRSPLGRFDPFVKPSANDRYLAKQTAGVDGLCSLMRKGGTLLRVSTLSGACVLCALAGA